MPDCWKSHVTANLCQVDEILAMINFVYVPVNNLSVTSGRVNIDKFKTKCNFTPNSAAIIAFYDLL